MNFSLKGCFLALLLPIYAHALVIQINQPIDFAKRNGEMSGYVVFKKRVHKELLALGKYQVSKNKKNVLFSITHIKKGEDYKTLSAQPSAIKETKGKTGLKKGTRIVLGGEDNAQIANLLGLNKETYRTSKGGSGFSATNTKGSSGANNGNANGSVSNTRDNLMGTQGIGNNPFPTIAGGNTSPTSVSVGGGSYTGGLGNYGGLGSNSFMPLPFPEDISRA
ncbi:unknown [Helicobacter bizzozeronii CCUG 35545]|nr:unknown [Helicobacter bizzozeronii CCUG 35545]